MNFDSLITDLNIENDQIEYVKLKSFSEETYSLLINYFLENDIEIIYEISPEEEAKDLDLVRIFFNDLNDISLKNKEEQYALFRMFKDEGSTVARRQLIECNIRLVISIAKHFTNDKNVLLDAIQDGCVGLINAIDRFDYKKGNTIATYATWWISQEIRKGLIERNSVLYFPKSKDQEIKQLKRAINSLCHCLNREPTIFEIHQKTNLSEDRISELLVNINLQDTISLNIDISGEDETELGDLVADEKCPDPQTITDENNRKAIILNAITSLNQREKTIILYRYGFIDGKTHTLSETKEQFNLDLTTQRISSIEQKGLKKLFVKKDLKALNY